VCVFTEKKGLCGPLYSNFNHLSIHDRGNFAAVDNAKRLPQDRMVSCGRPLFLLWGKVPPKGFLKWCWPPKVCRLFPGEKSFLCWFYSPPGAPKGAPNPIRPGGNFPHCWNRPETFGETNIPIFGKIKLLNLELPFP